MKLDIELFATEDFQQQVKEDVDALAIYKNALQNGDNVLRRRFEMGVSVNLLVEQRASLIDQLLIIAWDQHLISNTDLSLVAVGGYGRGELHPCSDIDITILCQQVPDQSTNEKLSAFITFLWDIGLEVGVSVRTIEQCVEEGKKDITVTTNLMESRLLTGNAELYDAMSIAIGPDNIWPDQAFFEAKLQEQLTRHKKFADTAHNLEPNIKEGPGGLRDIQMIGWVVKRYFGVSRLEELVSHGFLTEEEYQTLDTGQNFLWRVRHVLHLTTNRREDRLLFEHQRKVATEFGFTDDEKYLDIEHFMKLYFRTITELSRLNEMLLGFFNEVLLESEEEQDITHINKRFQIRNNHIKIAYPRVFKRYPFALLEIFLLIQQNPQIKGVRAKTIRAIRDHLYLIDDNYRNDLRNRSLFMEIIRQPHGLRHELQRMHRYGVLAAYLPAFEAVSGLMQFDLFHVYTVDEHILTVVRNLRRYDDPEIRQELPLCGQIYASIPKPELLYLAGLFHDIAKGRGGDHSELGVSDATDFCVHHGMGKYDTNLVAWLVRNHLLMSSTAQRMDLSDQEVIHRFAQHVGDKSHLDYLYLLTVADIRGTNPAMWNSWKDSLLKELYRKTLNAIRRGIENPLLKEERIAEVKEQVLAVLSLSGIDINKVTELWDDLGDDYFLRHSTDEITWQTESIIDLEESDLPVIKIRQETRRGGTEIFIYCHDRDSLFAAMTYSMDQMGLTVLDARIFTTKKGYNLDTYIVLEALTNEPVTDDVRASKIVRTLKQYLSAPQPILNQINRMRPRKLRSFKQKARLTFSEDQINHRTIMEVTAIDQPGLLAAIGMSMAFCGVRLHNAKVATYGERVEDIFYLTDLENNPIRHPVKFECLEHTILDALNSVNE